MIPWFTAFTEALTTRNGPSLAVKPQKVEEACQNASFICIFMKSWKSGGGGAAPFPKDTGWEPDLLPPPRPVQRTCAVQNCRQHPLGEKRHVWPSWGEKKITRRSVSTWLMKYFPAERSVHSFLPGTLAMPRNETWDQHLFQSWEIQIQQTESALLVTSKGNCTYQHNLLGSKSYSK